MSIHCENLKSQTSITAVFSCPDSQEEKRKRPCSGLTGKALEFILSLLSFNGLSLSRSLIGITNAWDKVEYQKKTKRSEASDSEILSPENIKRLLYELTFTDIAIAFGAKALLALTYIKQHYKPELIIIESTHLSPRNINFNVKTDFSGNVLIAGQKGNTKKRWEYIAYKIKKTSSGLFS